MICRATLYFDMQQFKNLLRWITVERELRIQIISWKITLVHGISVFISCIILRAKFAKNLRLSSALLPPALKWGRRRRRRRWRPCLTCPASDDRYISTCTASVPPPRIWWSYPHLPAHDLSLFTALSDLRLVITSRARSFHTACFPAHR